MTKDSGTHSLKLARTHIHTHAQTYTHTCARTNARPIKRDSRAGCICGRVSGLVFVYMRSAGLKTLKFDISFLVCCSNSTCTVLLCTSKHQNGRFFSSSLVNTVIESNLWPIVKRKKKWESQILLIHQCSSIYAAACSSI